LSRPSFSKNISTKNQNKESEKKKLSLPRYKESSHVFNSIEVSKPLHNNYNANQKVTPQRKAAEITHQALENSTMEELIKNDHAWVCHDVRLIHFQSHGYYANK